MINDEPLLTLDQAFVLMPALMRAILELAATEAIRQGFAVTDVRRVIDECARLLRKPARLATAKEMLEAHAIHVQ